MVDFSRYLHRTPEDALRAQHAREEAQRDFEARIAARIEELQEMVSAAARREDLSDWERQFVDDMVVLGSRPGRALGPQGSRLLDLSDAQLASLRRIAGVNQSPSAAAGASQAQRLRRFER